MGDFGSNGFSIYGADFDADGVLWAAGYSYVNPKIEGPALLRFSTADWSGIGVGPLLDGDTSLESPESLTVLSAPTVTPAAPIETVPTLPAMGGAVNLLLIGVAGGAVLLGALLLMRRRRPI